MAPLDSHVAKVLDRHVAKVLDRRAAQDREEDEDDLIDELENDAELDAFRERRRQQLHEEFARAQILKRAEHGTFQEVREEKAVLDITTSTKLCVVHFFKPDFRRCDIMNSHLEDLASKHLDCRFIRVDVENAPFLVTKLQIQMLPCVLAFIDGKAVDRIIGFEGLGRGTDRFTTKDLESRLLAVGVLLRPIVTANDTNTNLQRSTGGKRNDSIDDAEDDDWD